MGAQLSPNGDLLWPAGARLQLHLPLPCRREGPSLKIAMNTGTSAAAATFGLRVQGVGFPEPPTTKDEVT